MDVDNETAANVRSMITNQKIIDYFKKEVEWREKSIKPMDKRCKIPKKMQLEIKEFEEMIEHLERN